MRSNHPELVVIRECLEAHRDSENLLYLTDSKPTLQAINRWIGGGTKLSLTRSPDGDVRSPDGDVTTRSPDGDVLSEPLSSNYRNELKRAQQSC
jgi:hypothetical protein